MTRREEIKQKALSKYPQGTNRYNKFIEGAKWADKTMIEKAIDWLKRNAHTYIVDIGGTYEIKNIVGGKCWMDLRKYLEE